MAESRPQSLAEKSQGEGNEAKLQETIRDLRAQLDELSHEDLPGIVFMEINEGRDPATLYHADTGEPIVIMEYMVKRAINLRDKDGAFRFVADAKDAPEYVPPSMLCFMHKDAPEREAIDRAGLAGKTCPKGTLASHYSKTIHAQHRHKQEWAAYQQYLANVASSEERDERRQQLEATLTIARAAQGNGSQAEAFDCPDCDWKTQPGTTRPEAALKMHVKAKHGEGVDL